MINRVVLVGRITRDPELQQTSQGISYVRFSLACDRPFKNQSGEKTTDFINCIAFKDHANNISKYFSKGNRIGIVGHIQTGSYTNKEGHKVYTTDVIVDEWEFVESKSANTAPKEEKSESGFEQIPEGIDEELPFN